MREFTKSLFSFSWVMPLFGVRQAANFANPGEWTNPERTKRSLDAVGSAAEAQLGDVLKQAFDAGDRLQRCSVDLMFGMLGSGDRRGGSAGASASQTAAPPSASQSGASESGGHEAEPPPDAGGWGPVG